MSLPHTPQQQRLIVGYALTSKKVKSFFQPKLERLARKKGIIFVAVGQSRSLLDQDPFDIVLHKEYREDNPEVTVLDPPISIQHLHNRQLMLQVLADLNLSDCYGKVGIPKQLVFTKDPSSIPEAVSKARLGLPLVAKPLPVDGSAKSHELSLAYDELSLSMLHPWFFKNSLIMFQRWYSLQGLYCWRGSKSRSSIFPS